MKAQASKPNSSVKRPNPVRDIARVITGNNPGIKPAPSTATQHGKPLK